jgi:hypothetical protein
MRLSRKNIGAPEPAIFDGGVNHCMGKGSLISPNSVRSDDHLVFSSGMPTLAVFITHNGLLALNYVGFARGPERAQEGVYWASNARVALTVSTPYRREEHQIRSRRPTGANLLPAWSRGLYSISKKR